MKEIAIHFFRYSLKFERPPFSLRSLLVLFHQHWALILQISPYPTALIVEELRLYWFYPNSFAKKYAPARKLFFPKLKSDNALIKIVLKSKTNQNNILLGQHDTFR